MALDNFSSSHDFSFGARKRDFGYEPGTYRELRHWFKVFIGICTSVALSGKPIAQQARITLSSRLRGLWTRAGMLDVLENSAKQIQKQRAWNDGWIAVRGIIHYDGKSFTEDILERLHRLEDLLKPADLVERARTYALSDRHRSFDLEDDFDEEENASTSWRRAEEITRKIGAQVAQDMDVLNALLPEIVTSDNSRLLSFGRGLADGGRNKQEIWQILHDQLGRTPADKRQLGVFIGFLSACSESDPEFYHATLDSLINDELLGEWLPVFQTTSVIDKRGIIRLHEALDIGKADIRHFQHLSYEPAHESIGDDDLAGLLRKILSKEGGVSVAIEILKMRFYCPNIESPEFTKNLLEVARYVLSIYSFPGSRSRFTNQDYGLAHIAHICLDGSDGIEAAIETCQQMAAAITDNRIHFINYPDLSNALAKTQPIVFLDALLGNDEIEEYQLKSLFHDHFERRNNPLDKISDDDILFWCEIDPIVRYPRIATAIHVFWESEDSQEVAWKPIFYAIVKNAPDLEVVLGRIADSIRPMSWSGSRADIMQRRSILFQSLYDHENPKISEWAKKRYSALQEAIKKHREWEARNYRERNVSFE